MYKKFLIKNGFQILNGNIGRINKNPAPLPSEIYRSLIRMAICFNIEKQFDSALQILQNGSHLLRETNQPDHEMEALLAFQVANVYTLKGDFTKAETGYHQSLNFAAGMDDLRSEIYQNLGASFFFKEDYERSIQYYQKSLILCRENKNPDLIRIVDLLTNLGTVYSGKEDFSNGIACFLKADSILRRSNYKDRLRTAGLKINIGEIQLKLNKPVPALKNYQKASAIIAPSDTSMGNIRIITEEGMAECYSRMDQVDSALVHLNRILDLDIDNDKYGCYLTSRVYQQIGDILYHHKDLVNALAYYDKAVSTVALQSGTGFIENPGTESNEPALLELYRSLERRGECLYQMAAGDENENQYLERSYSDFLSSFQFCKQISLDIGQENSRMMFYEASKSVLTGILESGYLLQERENTRILYNLLLLTDSNRNRILLENLQENHALKITGIPDSLKNMIVALRNENVFYAKKWIMMETSVSTLVRSNHDEILNKILDLRISLDSLRGEAAKYYPVLSRTTQKRGEADLSIIHQKLTNGEAIVEYFCADSVLFIFLVKNDGITLTRIKLSSSFRTNLDEVLHLLKCAGTDNFINASYSLYNDLFAPIRSQLAGIRKIIIIPDEGLALLPFEALISEKPPKALIQSSSGWKFLLKDYEICYHYSVAEWVNSLKKSEVTFEGLSFTGFAPGFKEHITSMDSFSELPFAEKEVSAIAGYVEKVTKENSIFLGTRATEKNFRTHSADKHIIHIATHSIIDESDPMNTALILSPGSHENDTKDNDDGFLRLEEIGYLQLDASLVVLSACATGRGRITKTEGIMALTRGFYCAGAENILYSLWNISDRFTSVFMPDFYRRFLSGRSYSAALRETKLAMIADPATSLPYLWAGFVLLGDR